MKKKYIIGIVVIICIIIAIIILNLNKNTDQDDGKYKIVTTFYPIYIMTANITQGAENIELVNMADINTGCIHDYTLNTEDIKKIEKADMIIQNGLGLESFLDEITTNNSKIKIVNTSENITDLIQENNEINPHVWSYLN